MKSFFKFILTVTFSIVGIFAALGALGYMGYLIGSHNAEARYEKRMSEQPPRYTSEWGELGLYTYKTYWSDGEYKREFHDYMPVPMAERQRETRKRELVLGIPREKSSAPRGYGASYQYKMEEFERMTNL